MQELVKMYKWGNSAVEISTIVYFGWMLWLRKLKIVWGTNYPYTGRDLIEDLCQCLQRGGSCLQDAGPTFPFFVFFFFFFFFFFLLFWTFYWDCFQASSYTKYSGTSVIESPRDQTVQFELFRLWIIEGLFKYIHIFQLGLWILNYWEFWIIGIWIIEGLLYIDHLD